MSPERVIFTGTVGGLLFGIIFLAWLSSKPIAPNPNEAGEWWLYETQLEHDNCVRDGVAEDKEGKLRRVFKCPDGTHHLASYI